MSIDEIIAKRNELNARLHMALSTMERKDTIKEIRTEILHNQQRCPHLSSKYNWVIVDDTCPYCGAKLHGGIARDD